MASRSCWSTKSVGAQRGNRVRVFERKPRGNLYIEVWEKGRGKKRLSLGHKNRTEALKQAHEVLALRQNGEFSNRKYLTLGVLLERYWNEGTHARDGSLKTEGYRKNCAKFGEYLVSWFGRNTPLRELTPDRMEGYVRARRAGQISGRKVRVRSPQIELSYLKSAMRWATGVFENGKPLLAQSPLATYSPPRERDPRRPIVTDYTVQALAEAAPQVNDALFLLIVLMDATGRRLGSVLGLRWDDFDFERRIIHWRPELDKRRKTWVTPMPTRAVANLLKYRSERLCIGSALVFPSPRDPDKPVSKYLASKWLLRAYGLSGVNRAPGGVWHPFRRKWATERKQYPLRDVAAAGGWSDTQSLLVCYQQPDDATMRAVVDGPIRQTASS